MELMKIIFSCDWEIFSPDWEKIHLNLIGNGALFRPLRHPKKIPDFISIISDLSMTGCYSPVKMMDWTFSAAFLPLWIYVAATGISIIEPMHQKTEHMHMRKQKVLNLKFQASSLCLWLYSLVCNCPGQKPRFWVF